MPDKQTVQEQREQRARQEGEKARQSNEPSKQEQQRAQQEAEKERKQQEQEARKAEEASQKAAEKEEKDKGPDLFERARKFANELNDAYHEGVRQNDEELADLFKQARRVFDIYLQGRGNFLDDREPERQTSRRREDKDGS